MMRDKKCFEWVELSAVSIDRECLVGRRDLLDSGAAAGGFRSGFRLDNFHNIRSITYSHIDEVAHARSATFSHCNMNGRVYDPVIGRFLSPDPVLQDPANAQNYNKYSYVLNNPLKFTDPSGYVYYGNYINQSAPDMMKMNRMLQHQNATWWEDIHAIAKAESQLLSAAALLDELSGPMGGNRDHSNDAEAKGGNDATGNNPKWFEEIATGTTFGVGYTSTVSKFYLPDSDIKAYFESIANTYNLYCNVLSFGHLFSGAAISTGLVNFLAIGSSIGSIGISVGVGALLTASAIEKSIIASNADNILHCYWDKSSNPFRNGLYVVKEVTTYYGETGYGTNYYMTFYYQDGSVFRTLYY